MGLADSLLNRLEDQAERIADYKRHEERMIRAINDLESLVDSRGSQIEQLKVERDQLMAGKQSLEAEIETLRERVARLEQGLRHSELALANSISNNLFNQLMADKQVLEAEIETLRAQVATGDNAELERLQAFAAAVREAYQHRGSGHYARIEMAIAGLDARVAPDDLDATNPAPITESMGGGN